MEVFLQLSKKARLSVFAFFILSHAWAQQTTFQKTYGGVNQDYAYDMHTTSDGGYVLGGVTFSHSVAAGRCFVVKTDMNGDTLWTVNWGAIKDTVCNLEYINDIVQTSDGGFLTGGGKESCSSPDGGEISRLDANGNVLWSKTCRFAEDPYPVIQDKAGNFVVGGYVTGIGAGGEDGCIMKLDANGDTLWSRTYGGAGDEWFYHILQAKDGGYLAGGFTTTFGQGGKDIYLVKTDSNGKLLWSKAYGTALNDEGAFGHCIAPTSDGGYIVTGYGSAGSNGTFLMKIDSVGTMKWSNYYSGGFGHAVKQLPWGGFLIAGNSITGHPQLIKTDSQGNIIWCEIYDGGGACRESGWILDFANDGGYVTGGFTKCFGSGNEDMYLIKADTNGNSGCNGADSVITSSVAPFIEANAATIVMVGANTIDTAYIVSRGTTITPLCSHIGFTPNAVVNNNTTECSSVGQATSLPSGGTPPYTYSWAPSGQTTATITGLSAGMYTVTVTDNNLLTSTSSVTITKPPLLSATMGAPINVMCNGGVTGSAAITPAGGTAPYTYAWAPTGGSNATGTGLSAGSYTLTLKDKNGCNATASVIITQPAFISVVQDSVNASSGCNGQAKVTVSGGTAPYTYAWAVGGSVDSIQGECAGNYCCTITDNNGCSYTACVTIKNTTGMETISNSMSIDIYPNPVLNKATISFGEDGVHQIEIYDVTGRKLLAFTSKTKEYSFSCSNLSAGMYFIKVIGKKEAQALKLIKQ